MIVLGLENASTTRFHFRDHAPDGGSVGPEVSLHSLKSWSYHNLLEMRVSAFWPTTSAAGVSGPLRARRRIADQVGTTLDSLTDFFAAGTQHEERRAEIGHACRGSKMGERIVADHKHQLQRPGDFSWYRRGAVPPHIRCALSHFRRRNQDLYIGSTLIKHSVPRSAVDVLTGLRDA
jgi:hypothetical protein